MRNAFVPAVAVLSVLAALPMTGHAQTNDGGPDPAELRRQAIDRIENAYTLGDNDALRFANESAELRAQILAERTNQSREAERDGLARVSEPIIDAIAAVLICDRNYNRRYNRCLAVEHSCIREAHRWYRQSKPPSRHGEGRRPGPVERGLRESIRKQQLDNRLLRCQLRASQCISSADQKRATCYLLASLIPV